MGGKNSQSAACTWQPSASSLQSAARRLRPSFIRPESLFLPASSARRGHGKNRRLRLSKINLTAGRNRRICANLQPQQHPASFIHRASFSPCCPNLAKRGHGLTDGGLRPGTPLASSSLRHGSFFRTHPPGLRSCSAPPSRMTHPAAQPSSCQSDTRAAMILGRCLTA